jgi:hypothetical protein
MSLPYRQRRQLRRIRRALSLSDPRLASMLLIFARLSAGEQMPRREQLTRRLPPPLAPAALLISAVFRLVLWVLSVLWGLGRLAARGGAAVGRWLGRGARRAAGWLARPGPEPTFPRSAPIRHD